MKQIIANINTFIGDFFKDELSKRIAVGILLGLLVIATIWLNVFYIKILMILVFGYALYEWIMLNFAKMDFALYSQYFIGFIIVFLFCSYIPVAFHTLMFGLVILWCTIGVMLFIDKPLFNEYHIFETKDIIFPLGILLIAGGIIGLERAFPYHIVLILFAVVSDTCAYFSGKYLGKNLLAPNISPKKTIEGVAGGWLGVLVLLLILKLTGVTNINWIWLFISSIFITASAVIGDLFESKMKRIAGIKDSGNILPGHGGLLDRIDALVAVVPFVVIFNIL